MPSRIVREGILTSLKVDKLSSGAELFYRRLLNVVDDFGRYHGTPSLLRAACFPLKIDKVLDSHVSGWLQECVSVGLVETYLFDSLPYIEVLNFGTPRAKESKFKRVKVDANKCLQTQADANNRTVVVVESVVESVGESMPTACAPNFRASFLAAYPPCPNKKQGLVDAERHWFTLKPDEVERALAAVKVYAECVAKWTPQQRMRVPKPLTWLQDNGPEFAIERENWERGEERKADGSIYESEMETYNEPDKYGLAVTKRRYWRIENGKRTACFETRQAAQGL